MTPVAVVKLSLISKTSADMSLKRRLIDLFHLAVRTNVLIGPACVTLLRRGLTGNLPVRLRSAHTRDIFACVNSDMESDKQRQTSHTCL